MTSVGYQYRDHFSISGVFGVYRLYRHFMICLVTGTVECGKSSRENSEWVPNCRFTEDRRIIRLRVRGLSLCLNVHALARLFSIESQDALESGFLEAKPCVLSFSLLTVLGSL